MGCFSWIDCMTGEQIRIGDTRTAYVLVPEKFGGGHVEEQGYDGYGHFGLYDIFDLVADWNKEQLSEQMLAKAPRREEYCGLYSYEKEDMRKAGASEEEIRKADEAKRTEYYENALKRYAHRVKRLNDFKNLSEDKFFEKYDKDEKREIGIDIACYDWQNATIPYPIKITYDEKAVYENCSPSKGDPDQGL